MRNNSDEFDNSDSERGGARRGTVAVILMIVFAIGIVALLLYMRYHRKNTYSGWEELTTEQHSIYSGYTESEDGYVSYTGDGAVGHNRSGAAVWNISYNMKSPVADTCGSYTAVADRGSKTVCITDGTGANTSFDVSEMITMISVSGTGNVAVMTDDGEHDHIYVYSASGQQLLDVMTSVRKSGFPLTMAISPDGAKLVTSYVSIAEESKCWLTFYNFGDVGQNYSDRIVGSYSVSELVPEIRFVGDKAVAAIAEKSCMMYSFREVPEELKTITCPEGICSVATSDKYLVLGTDSLSGNRTLNIYGTNGNEITKIQGSPDFKNIHISGDEFIVTGGNTCVIYRTDGSEKFRAAIDEPIRLMYSTGSIDTYTIVGDTTTKTVRLKNLTETDPAPTEEAASGQEQIP